MWDSRLRKKKYAFYLGHTPESKVKATSELTQQPNNIATVQEVKEKANKRKQSKTNTIQA